MPTCHNCGSFITEHYVRVCGIGGEVHACPHCEDRQRSKGKPAAVTGPRQVHRGAKSSVQPAGGDD